MGPDYPIGEKVTRVVGRADAGPLNASLFKIGLDIRPTRDPGRVGCGGHKKRVICWLNCSAWFFATSRAMASISVFENPRPKFSV
jgi:hypothetical protein